MSTEEVGTVYSFLLKHGMKSAAAALLKDSKLDAKKVKDATVDLTEAVKYFKANNKRKAPVASSSSSSDSSDSSDSESDAKPAAAKKAKPAASDSDSSSSSSSSDSSDSEDEKKAAPAKKAAPVVAAKKAAVSSDSSSSSDSSDSEDEKPVAKKAAPAAKKAAPVAKKDSSSDSSSSSSSSSSSDSSDEEAAPPAKKAKAAPAAAAVTPKAAATAATPACGEFKAYVKGLPWLASEAEVKDFFKDCGKINSCELPMGDDGRSTGTAFVRFSDRASLDAAIAKDGALWPGTERWLKIVEGNDTPRRGAVSDPGVRPEGCDTVFVGNLPWDCDEEGMRALFATAGEVSSVRFGTDKDTGDFRGFGHVSFYEAAHAEEAVKLAGTDMNGRAIRVDYAPPRPARESFGASGGGRGGGGRGGGRGGASPGGRGGRGAGRGAPGPVNKNKGSIVAATGAKMTFDD